MERLQKNDFHRERNRRSRSKSRFDMYDDRSTKREGAFSERFRVHYGHKTACDCSNRKRNKLSEIRNFAKNPPRPRQNSGGGRY